MKCATRKIRPPVKWHGGKTYLARRIIEKFPAHDVYVEPFAGGLSTLLNKDQCYREIANDLNAGLIEMWRMIREFPFSILTALQSTRYASEVFESSVEIMKSPNPVERAIGFIIRNRMSRGGMGKDFAWSDRLRGGQPGEVNSWETFVNGDLGRIVERIQRVIFIDRPAVRAIDEAVATFHGRRVLIYADPPYVHETRTAKSLYDHEMTTDDHHDLVSCLKRASERGGKVFLSGYDNRFYREWIPADWTRHEFSMPNHSGQGKTKQRRIECL